VLELMLEMQLVMFVGHLQGKIIIFFMAFLLLISFLFFKRAYSPSTMGAYINQIAISLLVMAVFDREINCRRAAAAAIQVLFIYYYFFVVVVLFVFLFFICLFI
jgi:hypothetical protein